MLDFSRTWLPYIYLYGVGGIVFFSGIYIVIRAGSLDLRKTKHKLWLGVLFFGFAWYLVIHGILTMAALEYRGIFIVVVFVLLILVAILTLGPVIKSKFPWNK